MSWSRRSGDGLGLRNARQFSLNLIASASCGLPLSGAELSIRQVSRLGPTRPEKFQPAQICRRPGCCCRESAGTVREGSGPEVRPSPGGTSGAWLRHGQPAARAAPGGIDRRGERGQGATPPRSRCCAPLWRQRLGLRDSATDGAARGPRERRFANSGGRPLIRRWGSNA
jgi:hypothetical protein